MISLFVCVLKKATSAVTAYAIPLAGKCSDRRHQKRVPARNLLAVTSRPVTAAVVREEVLLCS